MSARPRAVDDTHDPALRSWVESANASTDFPIQNLPLGVFRRAGESSPARIGVAIGDQILDLAQCCHTGLLDGLSAPMLESLCQPTLNELMALGPPTVTALRRQLIAILRVGSPDTGHAALVPMLDAELFVPVSIGDFTDFYASVHHATNVGRLFRPDNPLLPNYKHLPVAYHGRTSSIVPSGALIVRPCGQRRSAEGSEPTFGPSDRLDYELEIGTFIGPGNDLARPIAIDQAEDHLFGICLLNDWSARDIQSWESQPLGPFLAKSFATSVSPWVVTFEALAPFRIPAALRPPGDPKPLPYLQSPVNESDGGIDISCEVLIRSAKMRAERRDPLGVSVNAFRDMYWTLAQMVAHHTVNGCNLRPGDLLGSGTVSGGSARALGCLLEITGGSQPLTLPSGESRTFLADGDEVTLRARCERPGAVSIGLGECRGTILPAR